MSDFVGLDVAGINELVAKLDKLPDVAKDEAIEFVNQYLLNVLKTYPPYKHVTFKQAYGKWFSEKQRRYVMARIAEGKITPGMPNRSQKFSRNWKVVGYGQKSIIANETPYGPYLVGNQSQSRMAKKIGWKTIKEIVAGRMSKIIRKADAGIKSALKKLNL